MTDSTMQYLVIQGRMPQDGSEPAKALILCPSWMSATLVCAGITGRIIEMTDGSVVEGRVLPYTGGEEELLAEIRAEFEEGDTQVAEAPERKIGMPSEMAAPYSADTVVVEEDLYKNVAFSTLLSDCEIDAVFEKMPNGPTGFLKDWGYRQFARAIQDRLVQVRPVEASVAVKTYPQDYDDAHRQGAQTERNNIMGHMSRLGMPPNTRPLDWVESLVKEQKNLDAWRDASAAAGLCIEYDDTGTVRKIFTAEESGGVNTSEIAPALNALLLEFGGKPGGEYLDFLRAELGDLAIYREQAAGRDLTDDVRLLQETIDKQEQAYDSLREQLQIAHCQLLERPTVMNFTGPVTINTTEVVVPE